MESRRLAAVAAATKTSVGFAFFHISCALFCLIGAALNRGKSVEKAAVVSAALYICTPLIDHGLFPEVNTYRYLYFGVFFVFDALWMYAMDYLGRTPAAIAMLPMLVVEVLAATGDDSFAWIHYEKIMFVLNIAFLIALFGQRSDAHAH